MFVRPAGSRKKRPIANRSAKTIVPTQAPPPMSCCLPSSSAGICGVGRDAERAEADLERLGERDHAAHDRDPQEPVALRPGHERLGDHLDLALRPLLRVGAHPRRAAPRTACAPPPPRWRCRASSRPRARPGRRWVRLWWPRACAPARRRSWRWGRSPHSSYRRSAERLKLQQASSSCVVVLGGLRDRLLGVRLDAHEPVALRARGSRPTSARRRRAGSVTVSTTSPSTVSLTGTDATAACPAVRHERLVAHHARRPSWAACRVIRVVRFGSVRNWRQRAERRCARATSCRRPSTSGSRPARGGSRSPPGCARPGGSASASTPGFDQCQRLRPGSLHGARRPPRRSAPAA